MFEPKDVLAVHYIIEQSPKRSPEGRKRISEAQKKRWAAKKNASSNDGEGSTTQG